MKIIFNDILLNEQAQPLKSLILNGKNLLEINYIIDAPNAIVNDKQNFLLELSFTIERAHTSENEAICFAFEHNQMLKNITSAMLNFIDDTSNKMYLKIDEAILKNISIDLASLSTTSTYTFIGILK